MSIRNLSCLALALVLAAIVTAAPAEAQFGKLKEVQKKAEKKVEKKVDDKVDQKMDETIDDAVDGSDKKPAGESEPAAEQTAASGGTASSGSETGGKSGSMKPGEGAWANYDFVPGDRVLLYDDFSKTPTGDFPQRLEFEKGNLEVVEWNGEKYLRIPTHADFNIPLPEVLPSRFTLEFDLYLLNGIVSVYGPTPVGANYHANSYILLRRTGCGVSGAGGGESSVDLSAEHVFDDIVHVRAMGDGKYLKVYINETRVANIPNADFLRDNKIHVNVYNMGQDKILMGHIRVAEGGKKILYDQLAAEGRVATRGIFFDSGSDRLRPESTPTLKEMAAMLKEHADLRLLIEGHTDDSGDDQSNQDLSELRAASVRGFLIAEYGIDASRLESRGFGESKPVSPNATPEGRQENRRVELVKL